jgi:hypothetical protein
VATISAAIAVLKGDPAPGPFSIAGRKEALLMLAHFLGDLHQPLHVAAVYLDDNGDLVDPDAAHQIDPATDTIGGNNIHDGHKLLHGEWDAIPNDLGEAATPELLTAARSMPATPGTPADWPATWASDTIVVAHGAFAAGSSYIRPCRPGARSGQHRRSNSALDSCAGGAGPRADRRASRTADHRDARHGVGLTVENSRPSGRPRNPF